MGFLKPLLELIRTRPCLGLISFVVLYYCYSFYSTVQARFEQLENLFKSLTSRQELVTGLAGIEKHVGVERARLDAFMERYDGGMQHMANLIAEKDCNVESLQKEQSQLRNQHKHLGNRHDLLSENQTSLSKRVEVLEKDLTGLKSRLKRLHGQFKKGKKAHFELKEEHDELSQRTGDIELEQEQLQTQQDEAAGAADDIRKELADQKCHLEETRNASLVTADRQHNLAREHLKLVTNTKNEIDALQALLLATLPRLKQVEFVQQASQAEQFRVRNQISALHALVAGVQNALAILGGDTVTLMEAVEKRLNS